MYRPTQPTKAPQIKKAAHDLGLRTVPERALVCFHVILTSLPKFPHLEETSAATAHRRLPTGGYANRRIVVREHERFAPIDSKAVEIDSIGNTK